jgi:DNA-binding NarL/FixJ family response regulator
MRLLIIAPNEMLVSLLVKVLGDEDDIDIVGAITKHTEAHAYAEQTDIVAFHADVAGPDLFDAIRDLRQQLPGTKVVLIHAPDLQDLVLGAIEVGAVGYVHSHHTVAQMLATLRAVHEHGAAIDPELTSVLVERMTQLSQQVRDQAGLKLNLEAELTDRQMEVLELVHQGLTNEEISERLYISIGTVKNHVHNILKTLEADNREQAAYWYAWRLKEHAEGKGLNNSKIVENNPVLLNLAGHPGIRSAITDQLGLFCRQLGWSIGHVYLLDKVSNQLVPTDIWHLDDPHRYQEFCDATARHRFTPRQDVIGNILFSPEPVWVADVRSYPGYVRIEAARRVGIRSGLILPLFHDDLIGVMEFYSIEKNQPDPRIVANIMRSSRELGHALETRSETRESSEGA